MLARVMVGTSVSGKAVCITMRRRSRVSRARHEAPERLSNESRPNRHSSADEIRSIQHLATAICETTRYGNCSAGRFCAHPPLTPDEVLATGQSGSADARLNQGLRAKTLERYCSLALVGVGRGGCCIEMNCVASRTPVPSGVGITIRKGTTTRVPAIGASHTSISR